MSSDILANLNPEQHRAVTAPEESVLILAGAGSGKTRVLTTRIAWLLEHNLATTGEILAVTFTNKAAKEMLTRLEGMIPYDLRRMWVGTFHGLSTQPAEPFLPGRHFRPAVRRHPSPSAS